MVKLIILILTLSISKILLYFVIGDCIVYSGFNITLFNQYLAYVNQTGNDYQIKHDFFNEKAYTSANEILCNIVIVLRFVMKNNEKKNGSILLALQMRHILASLDNVASAADWIQKEA